MPQNATLICATIPEPSSYKARQTLPLVSCLLLASSLIYTPYSNAQTEQQKRQTAEYKRLSEATQRAFAIPNRPAPVINYTNKATGNANSSSKQSNSSGNNSASSFDTGSENFSWADTSHINRQREAGARNDALVSAFEAKLERMEKLIKQRNLTKSKENYQALFTCAIDAGLDQYTAGRMLGFDADEYQAMLDRQASKNPKASSLFEGSSKSKCDGECKETLYYKDKSGRYLGNTEGGRPHGKGVLTLSNGDQFIGTFVEGTLQGDIVLRFADGNVYEGGFYRTEFFGQGKFKWTNGDVDEGTFKNNKLNGLAKLFRKKYNITGFYKDGVAETRGERLIEFPSGFKKIINYSDPTQSKLMWAEGTKFTGTFDEQGVMKKGTLIYAKGGRFTGEFKNGIEYRGIYSDEKVSFEGTFHADGKTLLVGQTVDKINKTMSESFLNAAGQKHGYRIDYTAKQGINEALYLDDKNTGPIKFTNSNGDLLIGTTAQAPYQLYGLVKSSNNKMSLGALTSGGKWITLPESERENVMQIFNATTEALAQGRAEYEAAMKQ
ncbi:hypothetical protein H8K52_12380 [Undibacterium seohonense]|uniref:MORN repeat protein n=1 Tax=Undibacterium seohonense TaxID=1344950 RepID=A0ABR6X5I0_9BURK|nr:hypothetical protein [Undibacterium seohonense]MBC3808142.1 hypothetical protein [Undibacterium seohonense]